MEESLYISEAKISQRQMRPWHYFRSMVIERPQSAYHISATRWVLSFVVMLPLVGVLGMFVSGAIKSFKVVSGSMIPTLHIGDCVIVKSGFDYQELRGKIIAFRSADDPNEILTKRVLGLERDTVYVRNGSVFVNSLTRPIPGPKLAVLNRSWKVGNDQLFVEGDNRNNSYDSVDYGPINKSQVLGVVAYRYWPFERAGTM